MAKPLPSIFSGPAWALPRRLDTLAEHWARLPWRLRTALLICLALTLGWWHTNRVNNVKAALGALHHVWVATETLTPGSDVTGKFQRTAVPGSVTPASAVSEEPTESPVLTIVEGTVATSAHFDGIDKAPVVPLGHRAIAINTGDADLFSPGSRVDLWDLSGDEPTVLVEQLIVVSVKDHRVIVGVPDARASNVVQRASSNNIRVAPAGVKETTPATEEPAQPLDEGSEPTAEHPSERSGVVPPHPSENAPEMLQHVRRSELAIPPASSSQFTPSSKHDARGPSRQRTRLSHAHRVYKPP